MVKKIKTVILSMLLVHILLLRGVYGQQPSGQMTEVLKQRFNNYCKAVPREEVYVHSDRSEYISGEDLWFNVYLVNRQTFNPSLISKIVYFELLNEDNRPVVQKRILVSNGVGPGQIILPDTLSTGTYTIRAYTNWMKNFLPGNCFMKDISIYNTLSSSAYQKKKHYPSGMEKFNREILSTPGINADIDYYGKDSLAIFINTSSEFRNENKNQIYLFIQTHGNINHVSSERLSDKTSGFRVPKAELMPGINQITVFDSKGNPVLEKYVFTPYKENNSFTMNVPDSAGRRAGISMELEQNSNSSPNSVMSDLSISVAPSQTSKDINFDSYMIFGSEYGGSGRITENRNLNEISDKMKDSILSGIGSNWIDWKLIMAGNIPHFQYKAEKEDHFLPGELLSENPKDVRTSSVVLLCSPGKEATFQYARTDSSGKFNFRIHVDEELKDLVIMPDEIISNQKIVIEPAFSDKYLKSNNGADTSRELIPDYVSKLSVNSQVQRIYGNAAEGASNSPVLLPEKPVRFYGKPDFELLLSDYIELPVMSEIFHELLPDVSLRNKKTGEEISITYHIDDNQFTTFPCLMIDGVIIKDASLISALDPALVLKIDVLKGKYVVGRYSFPGIINVITKAGDFNAVTMPDYMVRIPYRVIDPVKTFFAPDYSSEEMKESTIPDYRNTLYWNPEVKTDKDGKARVEFWSSDNKGDYVINIQGFVNGKMVSVRKKLKVY